MNPVQPPPTASPAPYRVEVVSGIEELPAGLWDRLAPGDDPMWSRALFAAMERSRLGPAGYAYLVVRHLGANDAVAAVLPVCLFRDLRLDQVVGARERRLLAPLQRLLPRLFPRLMRVPMLFCGHLLGQGHVLLDGPAEAGLGDVLVDAVLDLARRERLGTVVFKDFTAAGLQPLRPALRRAGFFLVPSLPDTELRLDQPTFEEYLAALPAKPRRNARSKIRAFAARTDLRIEVLDDFAHLLPEVLALYRQVMLRADQTLDVLDSAFLAAVHADPAPHPGGPARPPAGRQRLGNPERPPGGTPAGDGRSRRRLVACFEGERLVAFLLCFFAGRGATGARIGLDYRIAHDARLYHAVHHAAIRLAIASGCRTIRFAQTAYRPKLEMGCELVEQWYAMTHVRPLPRAVLRRLLPPALTAARDAALGPHATPRPGPARLNPPTPTTP
ncbi:GNAT family N-acetyltransferase [Kitasatospora sp. NBC_01560]|uniref:GNAT family N-acetyltransferase n=1 Tax=Kitasatospora sp. NBC_01560 TaxID=2975965 RepID=UPI003864FC6F